MVAQEIQAEGESAAERYEVLKAGGTKSPIGLPRWRVWI